MEKTFKSAADRIAELTKLSRKDEGEVMLSYIEELGELAQEIKIATGVLGTQHKEPGPDGVYGECADVWICACSEAYMKYGGPVFYTASAPFTFDAFKDVLRTHAGSTDEMMIWSMALALSLEPSEQIFCDKIHQKLDKWERNVAKPKQKFAVIPGPTQTADISDYMQAVRDFQSDDYVMTEAEAKALSGPPNYPKITPKSLPKRYRRWRV